MRLLIAAIDYPNLQGEKSLMYIHTRNKYYIELGVQLEVLNFSTKNNYNIDNVKVITLSSATNKIEQYKYDILVCHAPNLKYHYRLLKKYEKYFKKIVFIFHGHEIVKINDVYPIPYAFKNNNKFIHNKMRNIYDEIKILVWRSYFSKILYKCEFVFVSENLKREFITNLKVKNSKFVNKLHVINNSVGHLFESKSYDYISHKKYDFITVRSNIDSSVYCIDIINNIAKKYKEYNFLVIGKGEYFKYNDKSENIIHINDTFDHLKIIDFLEKSRFALMPTRRDTQGVMACELATYGIPLITSNIKVCKEIFKEFSNVFLVDNNNIDLKEVIKYFESHEEVRKNDKYFANNTIEREVKLYKKLIGEKNE